MFGFDYISQTRGQAGIVGQGCRCTNDDGVTDVAQAVAALARRIAGDPAAVTGVRGNFAVEAGGKFSKNVGTARGNVMKEEAVEVCRLHTTWAGVNGHAGLSQAPVTLAADARGGS